VPAAFSGALSTGKGNGCGGNQIPQTTVVLGEPGFGLEKEERETALGLDGEKVFSPEYFGFPMRGSIVEHVS
jgi:hypothetical protein